MAATGTAARSPLAREETRREPAGHARPSQRKEPQGRWHCMLCDRDLGTGPHHGVRLCVCGRCFTKAMRPL
ncbi:MAG: hypothetical protein ACYSU0_14800 [Planctomycetota bacterium]